jgi:Mrp family chromosome partitioning ATPase
LNVNAAIIVTTPQKLSFVDVLNGIDVLKKVEVQHVAVLENMSYFTATESGVKPFIVGPGHRSRL